MLAAKRISKARDALENHWPQVPKLFGNDDDLRILFGKNQPTEKNRQFYIENLKRVEAALSNPNGVINLCINNQQNGEDTNAYVIGPRFRGRGWIWGDTIYVNPSFFNRSNDGVQDYLLWHELGRFIIGLTHTDWDVGGEDTASLSRGEDLIRFLSQNYDQINPGKK